MKFVFAKSHPLVEPDWWMVLDSEASRTQAEDRMMRSTAREHLEPLVCHDMRGSSKATLPALRLDIISKAMAQHTMAMAFGQRDGWYANRMGGCCPSMHQIFKTVESSRWPSTKSNEELFNTASFSKWTGGKHWFVRLIDGTDVEWDGQLKWDTREEAEQATRQFLKLI